MADSCAQYVSTDDLKAAKESILHIEHVATSKDANGNPALVVTDPIRGVEYTNSTLDGLEESYKEAIRNLGWNPVGTFQAGATLNELNDIIQDTTTLTWYRWDGSLPKTVTAGSSPTPTGSGAWQIVDVSDVLRRDLASTSPTKGSALVANRNSTVADDLVLYAESFGDLTVSDATTIMQTAINAAASAKKELVVRTGTVTVTQLLLPSNTILNLGTSVLKRKDGTNKPLLQNSVISYTPDTHTNENLKIIGGTLDYNGANQNDTGTDGAWVVGVKFCGVKGLVFEGTTFANTRRFSNFITNCRQIRAYNTKIVNDNSLHSPNKDGWHINGNTYDFYADVITAYDCEDDAFALNADDIDFGGDMTIANISGPIRDITVERLILKGSNSRNGVRLLSAVGAHSIKDVSIGTISGECSVYALNIQDYNLGTSCWYQNIHIGSIDVRYNTRPYPEALMPMINIDTYNHNLSTYSDITIDNIVRDQFDVDGQDRYTIAGRLRRTNLRIGRIIEQNCANLYTVNITDFAESANITIDWHERRQSRLVSPLTVYGSTLHISGGGSYRFDSVKVGHVDADHLQHIMLQSDAKITNVEVNHTTITDHRPIYLAGASSISYLNWQSTDPQTYRTQSLRYFKDVGASVILERPAPTGGVAADEPVNAVTGDIWYNTTIPQMQYFNGTSWVPF